MRLKAKRAFVTAAGQGIGRATVEAFIAEGAIVMATDINSDLLDGLECETARLDVTDKVAVQSAIAEFKPDVLFNCAGFVHSGTILEATEEDWDFAFALNVRAMFHTMQAAVPGMVERGTGSIINMSSACSSIIGAPNRFIYGTTKAAVLGMTKSVAREYITSGLRCNAICPGTVDSPSLHQRLKATGDYETAMREFVARQPMGRIAQAEEIAALAVYLASDESAFTTGQGHVIDGGWSG
ncbi:SDR family oxidoreductase [Algicella marina]|uniref:SDR family oxidoreductase n=1 Tax=Algicella marina TaxID=2683284 RepID=A0A6P1T254_9RHOB|nr:SDR family oxidoreductase [Algicella marina]QHQ35536.1 SDR family oxidoreductase [Algicella marina]